MSRPALTGSLAADIRAQVRWKQRRRRLRNLAIVGVLALAFLLGSFGLAHTCWVGNGWGAC